MVEVERVALTAKRLVEVAEVEVDRLKVCPPVQVLALARFKEATTFPVVGEMVKVPSEFETDETPETRQAPLIAKHPVVALIPLAKVLVPDPCTLMTPVVSMTPGVPVALPTPNPPVIYAAPAMEVVVAGEDVPIPNLVFIVSNTKTVEVAAFIILNASA